ncbi:MAG: hypothetical protein LC637_03270, partial [Xanthomonadaceae bacterium]|nr:hypothetical protein [Xanthomonadaceae bacterium]
MAALTLLVGCSLAIAQAPTVNGLFYGDGDNERYPAMPSAVSENGSKIYATLVDNILYVALVVDR